MANDAQRLLVKTVEAAALLSISERMLWDLTAPRGPIPVIKLPGRGIARSLRYAVADLELWIEKQKTVATSAAE